MFLLLANLNCVICFMSLVDSVSGMGVLTTGSHMDQQVVAALQHQEIQLLTALHLKQHEERLSALQARQQEMLQRQEQQLEELIRRQIERQEKLEVHMKLQQERINAHIQVVSYVMIMMYFMLCSVVSVYTEQWLIEDSIVVECFENLV
jgi:hypothetical protein